VQYLERLLDGRPAHFQEENYEPSIRAILIY
jgi:hypothetical protein